MLEEFFGDVDFGDFFETEEAGGGVDFGYEVAVLADEEVDAGDFKVESFGCLFGNVLDVVGELDFFGGAAAGNVGFEVAFAPLAKGSAYGFAVDDDDADVFAEAVFDEFLEDDVDFAVGTFLDEVGDFAHLACFVEFENSFSFGAVDGFEDDGQSKFTFDVFVVDWGFGKDGFGDGYLFFAEDLDGA